VTNATHMSFWMTGLLSIVPSRHNSPGAQ
jgi:hypothetical protein